MSSLHSDIYDTNFASETAAFRVSMENRLKFTKAKKATTYDNLLSDFSISNADARYCCGSSGLHCIPGIGRDNKDIDTDILLSYLLTCDPPADVNGRDSGGRSPMWQAASYNNTSVVKVLIDFGGDRTNNTKSKGSFSNSTTPLAVAEERNHQECIKLLAECFPSEE